MRVPKSKKLDLLPSPCGQALLAYYTYTGGFNLLSCLDGPSNLTLEAVHSPAYAYRPGESVGAANHAFEALDTMPVTLN